MPTLFKSKDLRFKTDEASIENFKIETADPRLSKIVKSEHLIFDMRLLNPDQFSFPYHFHRHVEELIIITSGALTLRSPEGLQILEQGDIIFFEMGESSAHQLYNHTEIPCTYLDIKTNLNNDICEYPDSNKIGISPNREIFDRNAKLDYFKGEENIKETWEKLRNNKG